MPLPLVLGIGAGIAGIAGIAGGISGGIKIKEAKEKMAAANQQNEVNKARLANFSQSATQAMDVLGKLELVIVESFSTFSDLIAQIQNKPVFKAIDSNGNVIPTYSPEELKQVSVGAGVLLGGLAGAGVGVAGGFAAAGVTTAAVMALGTASTGAAISGLSGVAATNATLAALGGGAIAAGGGGMALGTIVLGGATLGVGLLVGGLIFNITGSKLSDKADEALAQVRKIEKDVDVSCAFLDALTECAASYYAVLRLVAGQYKKYIDRMDMIINVNNKTDWDEFTDNEKLMVENCSYLVGLLYNMCKVALVKKTENKYGLNEICYDSAEKSVDNAISLLDRVGVTIQPVDLGKSQWEKKKQELGLVESNRSNSGYVNSWNDL